MWPQLLNLFLGLWLITASRFLGPTTPSVAANDGILGLVVAVTALISIWEITRPLRWVNLVVGCWLLVAPLVLGCDQADPIANDFAVGCLLMLLASRKGKIIHRYGGGWAALWK